MIDLDLEAIKFRDRIAGGNATASMAVRDRRALISEVERLREEVDLSMQLREGLERELDRKDRALGEVVALGSRFTAAIAEEALAPPTDEGEG